MRTKILMILIPVLSLYLQSVAQGDLLITPNRVVFEGSKQKEELNLLNMGNDTATYSISFTQRKMNEDGSFVIIEGHDSGQMFADPYLRIFPRQVTLAPREAQVIQLQFRRKADMEPGEYRSHLYFRSEQNYTPLGMGKSTDDTKLVNVQLFPVFGMSIPVIIRTGKVNVTAALTDLKIEFTQDSIQIVKLNIQRNGNISIYGDLILEFIPKQGKSGQIGLVRGVGVYTNIEKRNMVIKLNNVKGTNLKNGKLKVKYISNGDFKSVVYAEAELDV
jgi:hypothetical protein